MQIAAPSTRFRNLVDIFDKYEKIDFMSLTEADQKGLLDVIPAPLHYELFCLIFPNGEAKSGSEALLELIVILPGGKMKSSAINYFPRKTPCVIYLPKIFKAA